MESNKKFTRADILDIELLLQEKIHELGWKTDALENTQRELQEARYSTCNLEMQLAEERRNSAEMRLRLEITDEVISRWEEERIKSQFEQSQWNVKYETLLNEHNSLIVQAKDTKLENMELKLKIQELEAGNASKERSHSTLKETLANLRSRVDHLNATVTRYVTKLQQDHESLKASMKATIEMNKRLQAAGLCAYAIQQKYKLKVQELQRELLAHSKVANASSAQNLDPFEDQNKEELYSKLESILKVLELESEEEDEYKAKLNAILDELKSTNTGS